MGVSDGWRSSKKGQFLEVGLNVGHPVETNGDFVAQLCSDARGVATRLFPNYFGIAQLEGTGSRSEIWT